MVFSVRDRLPGWRPVSSASAEMDAGLVSHRRCSSARLSSLNPSASNYTRALLVLIWETKPASISALAELTGRQPGNLSRTLKTMSNYGIVELRRERNQVRPVAKATEFRIVAQ